MIKVIFKNIFYFKIYKNNMFILKNIFNVNIKKLIFNKKKIKFFKKHIFNLFLNNPLKSIWYNKYYFS